MKSEELIDELVALTENHLVIAEYFSDQPIEALNHKPSPASWSTLECIEHLNYYANFYNLEIRKRLKRSQSKPRGEFKSGWLGKKAYTSVKPIPTSKKMRTFPSKNPEGNLLTKSVLHAFVAHLKELIELLKLARNKDLQKVKTSITLSPWIKLRLGDTLRFVIYHNWRHIDQAKRALEATENKSKANIL
jgi:hypothetical protein